MMRPILLVAAASMALFPAAGQETGAASPTAEERAGELLRGLLEEGAVGCSATVARQGAIVWSEGFGLADVEQQVPVSPETRFRIASISKPVTAAAVALLIERGRLDLDAKVQKYVPSFPVKERPITTRQLTGHLAGIRHYKGDEYWSKQSFEDVTAGLAFFKDDPLAHRPGSRFLYSSHGWNLVSAVVEGASGEPFLDYMQREVFEPLGMMHTAADQPDRIIPFRTRPYRIEGGEVRNAPYVDNSYKWAGGGFLSTAEDLVRFGSAHLKSGFLEPETLKVLFTSQRTSDGRATGYGVGWRISTDPQGRTLYSHSGGGVGASTILVLYPDAGVVAAILSNTSAPRVGLPRGIRLATLFLAGS